MGQLSFIEENSDKEIIVKEYKNFVIENIYENIKKHPPGAAAVSFIPWVGGKGKIAGLISQMCSVIKHDIYVEPFCGGASVYFHKKPVNISVLNDTNDNLVNLFNQLRDNTEEFLFKLFHTVKSKEQYDDFLKKLRRGELKNVSDVDRAVIYFNTINYAFSAVEEGAHFAFNDRKILYEVFAQLVKCAEKLNKDATIILNKDYRYVIKKFMKKKNVLFFMDPPYWVTIGGKYYKYVFKEEDHYTLKTFADAIHRNGNYFIITYDDVPEIRDLYQKYRISKVPILYSAQRGDNVMAEELIITNSLANTQLNLFEDRG